LSLPKMSRQPAERNLPGPDGALYCGPDLSTRCLYLVRLFDVRSSCVLGQLVGRALGSLFPFMAVFYNFVSIYEKWHQMCGPLVELRSRLYTRASWLALRSFLERAKAELRAPSDGSLNPDAQETELFVHLHARYMSIWSQSPHSNIFTTLLFTMFPVIIVLQAVINAACGSCIPAYVIVSMFSSTIFYPTLMILVVPVSNATISSVVSLYRDSERALDTLIFEGHGMAPTPERQHVINRLTACATLLRTFEKADHLRAKFLGVFVTWSFIKTYLLTIFTLAVGLWSIPRGFNLFVTV